MKRKVNHIFRYKNLLLSPFVWYLWLFQVLRCLKLGSVKVRIASMAEARRVNSAIALWHGNWNLPSMGRLNSIWLEKPYSLYYAFVHKARHLRISITAALKKQESLLRKEERKNKHSSQLPRTLGAAEELFPWRRTEWKKELLEF